MCEGIHGDGFLSGDVGDVCGVDGCRIVRD